MVDFTNLKLYRSTGDLGGAITGTEITTATPNNLFTNVPKNELVIGKDYYKCFYIKNTSTEAMANFKMWLSSKSLPLDTNLKWAWDPLATTTTGSGGYVTFDGVDDYMNCGVDATLWSQPLTKFSFCFWIRPTAGWDTFDRRVVGMESGGSGEFNVYIDPTSAGRIKLNVKDSGGATITSDSFDLTLNDDNFVACVYDSTLGSGNIKMNVNSTQGNTADLTDTLSPTSSLQMGNISNDYKGIMWDFRFWPNKALTGLEIDAIYDGADDSSVDYWLKMDEGTGNPVDFVSTTKVGTLANGAFWSGSSTGTSIIEIPDIYTAPVGIDTWNSISTESATTSIGTLAAGGSRPVWVWLHVDANAEARLDDNGIFTCNLTIPQGGTGSGGTGGTGGGTGGNPPPTATDYKIAIVGDEGCEPVTDDVIDMIQSQGYDYTVSVGDHAYESASCWTGRFDVLLPDFNSAYGNHEYSESGGTAPYKTFFGHSKTYFTFQFQNIFFLVIDTNIDIDSGSTQYNFISSELTRVANDSTITWKVAIMHHPWYGSGSDHPYNEFGQRATFHTLFTTHHVNFVCTGHNHNFQRTHQIAYNPSSSSSPTIVDSSSPYSATANGLIHVVSGTGGHDSSSSLYSLGSQPSYQAYQNRTHNGVWEMVASNNAQTLTCSFVDINGTKYDTFVINA